MYQKIISVENLELADKNARKGKLKQPCVKKHDENRLENIRILHCQLKGKTYKTSNYITFKIFEPKERIVYRLPYFPDRILHHAVMNVLKPIFISTFTADTYSSIKGRGIHSAVKKIKESLRDESETVYCLKIDIEKFYPNIDNKTLKILLRRKFKDKELLLLLDEIIDSAIGLPIGNYLSQYFSNFYLSYFDHWIKEVKNVKYYFRYADDMVFFSGNKKFLHLLLLDIKKYLFDNLKLRLKKNYQIYPVQSRGVDFLGYVFFHTHVKIRKRIKKNFVYMLKNKQNKTSVASYIGWLKHGDCINLTNKLLNATTKNN